MCFKLPFKHGFQTTLVFLPTDIEISRSLLPPLVSCNIRYHSATRKHQLSEKTYYPCPQGDISDPKNPKRYTST